MLRAVAAAAAAAAAALLLLPLPLPALPLPAPPCYAMLQLLPLIMPVLLLALLFSDIHVVSAKGACRSLSEHKQSKITDWSPPSNGSA